jgi:hypothetical protein
VVNHYIDVGDAQRAGEEVAVCSCGWRERVSDSEDMTSWERHVELMALANGHYFANTWMLPDDEAAAQRWAERTDDSGNNEQFVSDGL